MPVRPASQALKRWLSKGAFDRAQRTGTYCQTRPAARLCREGPPELDSPPRLAGLERRKGSAAMPRHSPTRAEPVVQGATDAAYSRWAPIYDLIFDLPFHPGRSAAARAASEAAGANS